MNKEYIEKKRALQLLEDNASDDEVFFAARAIEAEPPADVKPVVRGEWISKGENAFEWCDYKCSVCGQAPDYFVYGTEEWGCGELPNFCPNCGADMRKEANDER